MNKIPEITVHGRFQPPLHVNHWNYINEGFNQAEHVTILITNPYHDEIFEETAAWRNDPDSNPFTYDERVYMFGQFFTFMGISKDRYDFQPFNIKNDTAFGRLDKSVPNLVNIYSDWSSKKVALFREHGLPVIALKQASQKPVSGTMIRSIIKGTKPLELKQGLETAGFMPQAIPGLISVLETRANSNS